MIVLDSLAGTSLDLDGFRAGTTAFTVLKGVKCRPAAPGYQWIGRQVGAALLADPEVPNFEIEIPLRVKGNNQDAILQSFGKLRDKADKAAAASNTGGMETTVKIPGATYTSSVQVLAIVLDGEQEVDHTQVRNFRKDTTIKLICLPFYLGPEKTAAQGRKPQGVPAADITIAGSGGDLGGLMRVETTARGTIGQQFALLGSQWRNAVAGNTMLNRGSALDVTSPPMTGSTSAGTNEVQTLTKAGTISGGTWGLTWEGFTFNAAFAYNAAVATVQAAIDAQIGAGRITVGGSPLSAGNMTFTFVGDLAARDVAALGFTSALTGGGTVTQSTTTAPVSGYAAGTLYSSYSSIGRTPNQSDTGTFQIWALVQDQGTTPNMARIRAAWSVGDVNFPRINRSALVPASGVPIWVYLGDVHITPRGSGQHRWNVRFDGKTLGTPGTQLRILDWLKVPTECGRAVVKTPVDSTQTLVLSDSFGQTAGNYTAKSMDLGGVVSGSGDADDFTLDTTNARLQRAAVSDAAQTGRFVVAGANLSDCFAQVDYSVSGFASPAGLGGLLLRYVNTSNYVFAAVALAATGKYIYIFKCVAGVRTLLQLRPTSGAVTLFARARSDGTYAIWDSSAWSTLSGYDADFATGGPLASGKCGIYDEWTPASAVTRYFDNFKAYALPAPDAAVFAGRKIRWMPDGDLDREALGGTYYGTAAGAMRAGIPILGAAGPDGLSNRLVIATADFNPDQAASSNPPAAFDYAVYVREAFQLGRWSA